MASFTPTSAITNAEQVTDDLLGMVTRSNDLSVPLDRIGLHLAQKANLAVRNGSSGIKGRHGAGLMSSHTYAVTSPFDLVVGSNKTYAKVQMYGSGYLPGGVIVPAAHEFLAIPAGDNIGGKDPKYLSPRDVPDARFVPTKSGNMVVLRPLEKKVARRRDQYGHRGKESLLYFQKLRIQYEILFVLARQVKIEPTMYLKYEESDQIIWNRLCTMWIVNGR